MIHLFKQASASLNNNRSFVVTVALTLGLAIGALLTVLTIGYVSLVQSLPYQDEDKLYLLQHGFVEKDKSVNNRAYPYPTLMHIYNNQTAFEQTALMSYGVSTLTSHPEQVTVPVAYVSPEYFNLLTPTMALGRWFSKDETVNEYNPVAVLSHESWQTEFNGDPQVLERTLSISGTNFRIVGVIAKSFVEPELLHSGRVTKVFLPWDFNTSSQDIRNRWQGFNANHFMLVKKSDSVSAAQASLKVTDLISPIWREEVSAFEFFAGWDVRVDAKPLKEVILGDSQRTIIFLVAGIIGLVLISIGNITNLYISRMSRQSKKLTILASIGANRKSLFQLIWAESFIVMGLACVLALLVAQGGFLIAREYLNAWLPRVNEVSLNFVTISLAILLLLFLSTLFARICAGLINYRALAQNLKGSGKGTGIQVSAKARKVLVGSQVAIATTLIFFNLIILSQSVSTLTKPLGFELDNVSALTLIPATTETLSRDELRPSVQLIKRNLESLPQVKQVSLNDSPFYPMAMWAITDLSTNENYYPQGKLIDYNYFSILKQPLVEGRYLTKEEVESRQRLMIVNEAFAERLAQDGPVIGAKLTSGSDDYFTVVGVVKNRQGLRGNEVPYRVHSPTRSSYLQMLIETHDGVTLTQKEAAELVKASDRKLAILAFDSLEDTKAQLVFVELVTAVSTFILALLTFTLAAIGLFGIFSFGIQIRTFELGTRLAIGARRKDIASLIWRENLVSLIVGLAISMVSIGVISILLGGYFDVQAQLTDIVTFVIAVAIVLIVSWSSCVLPLLKVLNKPVIHSLRA